MKWFHFSLLKWFIRFVNRAFNRPCCMCLLSLDRNKCFKFVYTIFSLNFYLSHWLVTLNCLQFPNFIICTRTIYALYVCALSKPNIRDLVSQRFYVELNWTSNNFSYSSTETEMSPEVLLISFNNLQWLMRTIIRATLICAVG